MNEQEQKKIFALTEEINSLVEKAESSESYLEARGLLTRALELCAGLKPYCDSGDVTLRPSYDEYTGGIQKSIDLCNQKLAAEPEQYNETTLDLDTLDGIEIIDELLDAIVTPLHPSELSADMDFFTVDRPVTDGNYEYYTHEIFEYKCCLLAIACFQLKKHLVSNSHREIKLKKKYQKRMERVANNLLKDFVLNCFPESSETYKKIYLFDITEKAEDKFRRYTRFQAPFGRTTTSEYEVSNNLFYLRMKMQRLKKADLFIKYGCVANNEKTKFDNLWKSTEDEVLRLQKLNDRYTEYRAILCERKSRIVSIFNKKWLEPSYSEFIAIDLETTGLDRLNDRIIEFSGIRYVNGQECERLTMLINPHIPIPTAATNINGINNQMVMDAPSIEQSLPTILSFLSGKILVAHNANFDVGFLETTARRLGIEVYWNYVDTISIAKKLLPGLENYKLKTVLDKIGYSPALYHRAEEDCRGCAQIMLLGLNSLI